MDDFPTIVSTRSSTGSETDSDDEQYGDVALAGKILPMRELGNLEVTNANMISEDSQSFDEVFDCEELLPVPHCSVDDSECFQPLLHRSISLTDHIQDDFVIHVDAIGDRASVEPIRPAKWDSSVYLPKFLTVHDEPRKSSKSIKQGDVAMVTRYENCDVPQALNSDLDAQDTPQDHISRLQVNEEGGIFVDNLPKVPMTIDIPAGTVRTQTNIAIIQSFNRRFMPIVDNNEKIIGPLIHFFPHQLRLEKTMTVTLRLPQLNPSNSYHILYSPTKLGDECEWIDLTEPGHSVDGISSKVNANAKEVVLSLLHYCVFIIIEKATGLRTEAKFCQLQASLLLHPTNDMVQVDVKVDTDDVMTEFDVRQSLCVRNNGKPLELTVETSLFEPPAGYSIVPVTPNSMVLPFMSVWRNRNPSATFHFQLKGSSQVQQDVFLVCRVLAQQQEGDDDAVTLELSRQLQLMANVRRDCTPPTATAWSLD